MCRSNTHLACSLCLTQWSVTEHRSPLSQSTTSFRESSTSLLQTLPPTRKDIEFSDGEYEEEEEEYEEEEEEEEDKEEEEEEKEVKKGKVQSIVWWFLADVDET